MILSNLALNQSHCWSHDTHSCRRTHHSRTHARARAHLSKPHAQWEPMPLCEAKAPVCAQVPLCGHGRAGAAHTAPRGIFPPLRLDIPPCPWYLISSPPRYLPPSAVSSLVSTSVSSPSPLYLPSSPPRLTPPDSQPRNNSSLACTFSVGDFHPAPCTAHRYYSVGIDGPAPHTPPTPAWSERSYALTPADHPPWLLSPQVNIAWRPSASVFCIPVPDAKA